MTFPCLFVTSSSIQCDVSEMAYETSWLYLKSEGLYSPLALPPFWNACMKAGVQAAILISTAKAYSLDRAMESWKN